MDPLIALMVLVSAALHPLWNALIKRDGQPEAGFLAMICMLMVLGGTHSLVAGHDLLAAWRHGHLIVMSAAGQVLYGSLLALTLRRGDLSTYYPIIRSSPVFIVAVGLATGASYGAVLLAGIAMVVAGAFFLQFRPGARLLSDPATLLMALGAMAGTGIYSISDSALMREIEPPVLFFWIEILDLPCLVVVFTLLARRTGGPGTSLARSAAGLFQWLRTPLRYAATGVICYASYFLILLAFQRGGDVAAVAAVRQASIPFSVLIGGLWLKEARLVQRLAASAVLAAGIVVIVLSP
ncbi:MAG: hypothetical protein H6907_19960 [Hyphomicrobiales bacterium]|nr:hypothetical protein [Hyphomicrobiales bacterium]MCP5374015.1 hypothetical protein [Hyphomicrobiales bacterium]